MSKDKRPDIRPMKGLKDEWHFTNGTGGRRGPTKKSLKSAARYADRGLFAKLFGRKP